MVGVPEISKSIDAWDSAGGKPTLIYGNAKVEPFKALPVAAVRLKGGDHEWIKQVNSQDTRATYEIPLKPRKYEVIAELLDSHHEVLTGAYYVYCRMVD